MLIGQGAIDASKIGTSIAIRYACKRPQFGERRVMEYVTHQRRLLPGLASTYAMHLAMLKLKVKPCLDLESLARLAFLSRVCLSLRARHLSRLKLKG